MDMEGVGLMMLWVLILGVMGCGAIGAAIGARVIRGSGKVATEEHQVCDFKSVTFATLGELIIEPGEEEGLRIEAEDNLLPYFETEIQAGELLIRQALAVTLQPTRPVKFYLRIKTLEALAVSGNGSAVAERLTTAQFAVRLAGSGDLMLGQLEAESLRAQLSGTGSLHISELRAAQLEAQLTGAGSAQLAGEVLSQTLSLRGAGDYRAAMVRSGTAVVTLSGSGAVQIHAIEKLEVHLTGNGTVVYTGAPTVVSHITGLGQVYARKS